MSKTNASVFDKVLTIGPDKKNGAGGISAVLASYSQHFSPFNYLASNSRKGTLAGLARVACTMVRMPFARMKGRRILHVHYASGKSWKRKSVIIRWARILGFKVVTHCHSAEMKLFVDRKGIPAIRKVLDRASANIVLSKSWEEYFVNHIGAKNVHVVNNIVGRPSSLQPKNDSGKRIFLFLGYIGDRKGIFDILAAASRLKEKQHDFGIIIGGNGEVERLNEMITTLGLSDRVDFRGWVRGPEKDQLLATSHVLMLPSRNEGLPISILEAMSYGKGVITSPVGGIPEIITDGHNGLMVEPGNVEQIERAMERYIVEPDLAPEHGKASKDRIEDFYPEAVRERLSDIYTQVLRGK